MTHVFDEAIAVDARLTASSTRLPTRPTATTGRAVRRHHRRNRALNALLHTQMSSVSRWR